MDCWELADKMIGESKRVLLYGPPGTGKTYAATTYNLNENGVDATTLTEDSSAAELRGFYLPSKEEFKWQYGTGINAWLKGGRLVVNEIDHAGGDVSTFLHALLDDPDYAFITLPNEEAEIVRPAKGFHVVATMNGTPDMLNPALADRFPVKIDINKVHPKALEVLSEDLRQLAGELAVADEARRTSIRSWIEFDRLRKVYDKQVAATAVFGSAKAEDLLIALDSNTSIE